MQHILAGIVRDKNTQNSWPAHTQGYRNLGTDKVFSGQNAFPVVSSLGMGLFGLMPVKQSAVPLNNERGNAPVRV